MADATTVTLRFFAAARAAAGTGETSISASGPLTIADALSLAKTAGPALDAVVARCSFLVNAVAETDRNRVVSDGDVVDVLPPFAGG